MIAWRLDDVVRATGGRLVGDDTGFHGLGSDTRTLRPGELFVALQGPNFDGNDYVEAARRAGAAAALVSRPLETPLPLVVADDSLRALGDLARAWRLQAPATVVGLTGSNGKTTLKEMLAAILGRRGPVLATRGNLNNAIGVPLTLARLADEPYAVIEMGANHGGEIDYLTRLVRPDIAVLNNAGRAHLEGFGSLEGVARAKAEIMHGLADDGVFVFNADDAYADLWRDLAQGRRQCTFGVERPADVRGAADDYAVAWDGPRFSIHFGVETAIGAVEIALPLAGRHNRMNALAAIAAALEAGATLDDARAGLATLQPVRGRLCPRPAAGGGRLIDDSYNANPDSVLAALQVLAAAPGRRTLVLGDLAELGDDATALMRQLGEAAAASGIERLFTCGTLSAEASRAFSGEAQHFADREMLVDALIDAPAGRLGADDTVLVKGSRAARMDLVVDALAAGEGTC
jgi:UDP-N-acetylmuramoyl-tripeptide--D-alanyl-D-alanine ligase